MREVYVKEVYMTRLYSRNCFLYWLLYNFSKRLRERQQSSTCIPLLYRQVDFSGRLERYYFHCCRFRCRHSMEDGGS